RLDEVAGPGNGDEVTFARIQTEIFDRSCVGCHRGGGDTLPASLDLSTEDESYQNLVNVPSQHPEAPGRVRVVPGDPDASFLVTKLEGGPDLVGSQMPLGGSALSDSQIQLVRDWIAAGAVR
ncbi:MAG TPA: hypothetical protein VF190_04395, partial [Rhodothermales bacterium]